MVKSAARMQESVSRQSLSIHAALLLVIASWGANFVAVKTLVQLVTPVEMTALRLVLAACCFLVLLMIRRERPMIARSDWPRLVLVSLLGLPANTLALAMGSRLIPAAVASLIVSLNPIFTAVVSRLLIGEAITWPKRLGIGIAFLGFLIILRFGSPGAHFNGANVYGALLTLLAPLSWAFYTVLSKPLVARYAPLELTASVVMLGALPLAPVVLVSRHLHYALRAFPAVGWLALFISAVLALALAFTLWYRALRILTPVQLAVYIYLTPFFGVLSARLVLGEQLTPFVLLGGLLILLGVMVTNTSQLGKLVYAYPRLRRANTHLHREEASDE